MLSAINAKQPLTCATQLQDGAPARVSPFNECVHDSADVKVHQVNVFAVGLCGGASRASSGQPDYCFCALGRRVRYRLLAGHSGTRTCTPHLLTYKEAVGAADHGQLARPFNSVNHFLHNGTHG